MRAIIKLLLFLNFFVFVSVLSAQNDGVKLRKTVIKTNLASPVSLGVERAFGRFSLSAYYNFFKITDLQNINYNDVKIDNFNLNASGLAGELRFYVGKSGMPKGFFLGAFVTSRPYDANITKTTSDSNGSTVTTDQATASFDGSLMTYGGMLGIQTISKGGFSFGLMAGVGAYQATWSDIAIKYKSGSSETRQAPSSLDELKNGIVPRVSMTLGWAF